MIEVKVNCSTGNISFKMHIEGLSTIEINGIVNGRINRECEIGTVISSNWKFI